MGKDEKNMTKILHIAYLHRKDDIRIVQKECMSLVRGGYKVYYTTADLAENGQTPKEIHYIPLKGKNDSILVNYIINRELKEEYCRIIEKIKPQIVHIHEYGISYLVRLIKKRYPGIRVIYDVHEDNVYEHYEEDVDRYGKTAANVIAALRGYKEHEACKYADRVIAATSHLEEILVKYCKNVNTVNNYPIVNKERQGKSEKKENIVCYAGGLTEERGISKIISVSPRMSGKLYLAGPVSEKYLHFLQKKYKKSYGKSWFYIGFLSHEQILKLYEKSSVGICLFQKCVNQIYAMPNKLFEYMEAGIPVVVSDFSLWRKIVEEADCGYCVNERDSLAICKMINKLLDDPETARRLGENGKKAALQKYNWKKEENKLLQIYKELV